jgi:hypothetical protein
MLILLGSCEPNGYMVAPPLTTDYLATVVGREDTR